MSGNLERTIQNTQTLQDIELAEAMNRLKNDPAQLRTWLTTQQQRVFNEVTKQKEEAFDKVYGDFDRSTKVEESILMHNKRAKELSDMVQQIYENQETSAQSVVQDKELATRKKEMNEWSVGNKQDTLFVFSSLFIVLSGLLLLTGLWRMGMISSALWVAIGVPLLLIFLLILLRRWRYTEVLRNKRYWNKQIFEGKTQKINVPNCPQLLDGVSDMGSRVQGAATDAVGAVTGAVTGAIRGAPTA
jgi:hypothetical protein